MRGMQNCKPVGHLPLNWAHLRSNSELVNQTEFQGSMMKAFGRATERERCFLTWEANVINLDVVLIRIWGSGAL